MTEDRFGIVGKVVARTYKVQQVVAEGGFGVVYRAFHQGFRAEVALKCLKVPNELSDDQRRSFLEQFRSEAEVLFRLSAHDPHIVRPLHVDAFHTTSRKLVPFMALEWLEGRTLDALIQERRARHKPPLSLNRLAKLLTPVARALERAHNLPGKDGPQVVVHRDMKPENLFVARVGEMDVPKILDFGISKVKSTAGQMVGRASLNADALVAFSPAYAAPEQWAPRSYGQTGRWTDVWGLAITVLEAAKGAEVISGDQAEMMGTILDPSRRPTPRNVGIPVSDAAERVFQRALAVDPRQRYQSVGVFWDDLTMALGIQAKVGVISLGCAQPEAGRATTGFDSLPPTEGPPDAMNGVPPLIAPPALEDRQPPPPRARLSHAPPQVAWVDAAGPLELEREAGGFAETHQGARGRRVAAASRSSLARPSGGVSSWSGPPRPYNNRRSTRASARRADVWRSLSPALSLIALSVAVTLLDRAVAHSRGVPLVFGSIRASWIAGGLMVIALITGAAALKRALDE